jgi:enterochelin esterase-like enzyme/outer membrane protein assembly factor BamB
MILCRKLIFAVACCALSFVVIPSASSAEEGWPGLRGPSSDGAIRNKNLFEAGSGALEVTWKRDLGSGYPVVTIDDSRVVTAFHQSASDVVAAFDRETGAELWRYEIGEGYKGHTGSHDGPIATPALVGGRVFGIGPRGHFFALDAETGKQLWAKHLVEDFQSETPFYGFGSSPVVAGSLVIAQIGAGEGKAVAGFGVDDGELIWSTGDDKVEYQSPILATFGATVQVVVAGGSNVSGLDPASGEVLWSYAHGGDERAMGGATIVPIPAGENRILLLSEHPQSLMLEIDKAKDGDWNVNELWKSTAIKATYVQPVYHDGYLYGMNSKIFTCVDAATGETVWRAREPGDGFPTLIGDQLVVMSKPGVLRVAKASPEGYEELASLELFDEVSWSAPAYADGSLYLRSMGALARVDIAQAESVASAELAQMSAAEATGFVAFLAEIEGLDSVAAKSARIDSFLEQNPQMPLIEDGGAVHFLYRGGAEDVGIVGDMIGIRREDPMIRVADTDLFYYSTHLESEAAVHYGFLVDFGEPVPDARNPASGESLFGEVSFLEMPARRVPDYSSPAPEGRQGKLEEITWESAAFEGKKRSAQVYLPAGFDASAVTLYPTLYLHEGKKVSEREGIKNVLDYLVGEAAEPLLVVFVVGDPDAEGSEYRNPAYTKMFLEELIPLVDERYPTIDDRLARATAGVGGAADYSVRLGFDSPGRIGRIGALWPSLFAFEGEAPAVDDHRLVIYQRWGAYHIRSPHENFNSAVFNRQLQARLRELGQRPSGGEVPEGWGWNCWRGYIPEMLRALFPMM